MKVYKDRTVCYLLLTDREETPTSTMKVYKDRTVCYLLLTDRKETPTSTMKVYKDRTVCYSHLHHESIQGQDGLLFITY
jgi:hypothetical protein